MCQFVESIKLFKGIIYNLPYHQARLNRTFKKFYPGITIPVLEEVLQNTNVGNDLIKCRVLYSDVIDKVEYVPYVRKKVEKIRLVVSNNKIDYSYKYLNREYLNQLFSQRNDCDDILIVYNQCITDAFSSNIIFYDGHRWVTPDTPLLPGTTRARLIDKGIINEMRITIKDLKRFTKFQLINAINDFEENEPLPINNII